MAEVIDISDDEQESLFRKQKTFKCLNSNCRSTKDLIKANNSVKSFFGVRTHPKKSRVCTTCSAHAKSRNDALIRSVRTKCFFHVLDQDDRRNEVVLMESDSDKTDDEKDSDESEYEFDPNEFYSYQRIKSNDMEICEEYDENDPQERVRELIGNITEELGLKKQIDDCSENIKQRLTVVDQGFQSLDEDCKIFRKKLDKLRAQFYDGFKQDIKWLNPIEIGPTEVPKMQKNISESPEVIAETTLKKNLEDLPPIGELVRHELKIHEWVYCMKYSLLSNWSKAVVLSIEKKEGSNINVYKVTLSKKSTKEGMNYKFIYGKNLAYFNPAQTRIPVGTRIIAKFRDECQPSIDDGSYFVGIIAEIPNGANNYRYLVFFDDGYAQYVLHSDVRVVVECSSQPWEDVSPDSRDFIKDYLRTYPERPMVRLQEKSHLLTECDGEWIKAKVIEVDGSLVKMFFPVGKNRAAKTEWIYRGSTRLSPLFDKKIHSLSTANQNNKVIRRRTMPFNKSGPIVEYLSSYQDKDSSHKQAPTEKRAVARKSTSGRPGTPPPEMQALMSKESQGIVQRKVIYPKISKFKPHQCSSECVSNTLLESVNISPLLKCLQKGWRRQTCKEKKKSPKNVISYIAPCGRRLRTIDEVFRFLRLTECDLEIDSFTFDVYIDPMNEWYPSIKKIFLPDITTGVEKLPISCVNSLDETLPLPLVYCNVRQPTENVNLNLDPQFLVCCSCTDDCQDKSRCECWQLTVEAYESLYKTEKPDVGYKYRKLPDQIASGIYECNSMCACKSSCLNKVVQHPIKQKLQLFKTARRGWGVRTLHDIPQGTFISVYVGKVLSEALANKEGKMTSGGDDYYAELDFIETIESIKEGYESDVEDPDFEMNENGFALNISNIHSTAANEDAGAEIASDDGDFAELSTQAIDKRPPDTREPSARIQARSKRASSLSNSEYDSGASSPSGDTEEENSKDVSDVHHRKRQTFEPVSTTDKPPKQFRPMRELFGEDEAVYIMDAKVSGNIGRYFNHSCQPNIFVQNVFVDTHDIRFPWVAFFTSTRIRAGSELTWDYNYEIGSVPGKIKYCFCMSRKCRGRLL